MNESKDKQRYSKSYFVGIIIAACVFFAGFVMLNIMWIHWKTANPDSSLSGLYDYKAATIGDGFCLPLLVFSLSCYSFLNKIEPYEIRRKARRKSCLIGAASALLGFVIQISWLTREGGEHNWTIPRDHHFNYAGWYHAFFFVCMFGVIAFFLAEMFQCRRYAVQDVSGVDHLLFGVFSFSAAYYVMLQRLDDMSKNYSNALIIIGFGAAVLIVISLLIFLSKRSGSLMLIEFCFSSIVLAGGMAYLSQYNNIENLVYPICIFFLSFSFLEPESEEKWGSIKEFMEKFFYMSFPIFIFNTIYLTCANAKKYIIISLIFVLLIPAYNYVLLQKKSNSGERISFLDIFSEHKLIFTFQVIILAVIVMLSGQLPLTEDKVYWFDQVFNVSIIWIGSKSIAQTFNLLIKEENRVIRGEQLKKLLSNKRMFTYGKIILISIGLIIYLVFAPSGVIQITSVKHIININLGIRRRIAICMFLIATLLLIFLIDLMLGSGLFYRSEKNEDKNCWGSSILFGIIYLISSYCMYLVNKPYTIKLDIIHLCGTFQIIGCSALVAESFYSNIYSIRDVDKKNDFTLNSIIIFLGSIMFLVFTIMPSNGPSFCLDEGVLNVGAIIIGLFGNTMILVVFPYLLFFATCPSHYKSDHILEGPKGEVAKNGFLAVMIAFLAGALPIYISLINKNITTTYLAVIILVISVYGFVTYCTGNNVKHLKNQEKKAIDNIKKGRKSYDSEKKRIITLKNHLQRQNIICLFSLLLYCIIPIIIHYISIGNGNFKSFIGSFKKLYIPELRYFEKKD